MKRFLIVSTVLFIIAVVATVVVFWLVNTKLPANNSNETIILPETGMNMASEETAETL
jgi:hypothetical protein